MINSPALHRALRSLIKSLLNREKTQVPGSTRFPEGGPLLKMLWGLRGAGCSLIAQSLMWGHISCWGGLERSLQQPSLRHGFCTDLNTCNSLHTEWVIFPSHFPLGSSTYFLFSSFTDAVWIHLQVDWKLNQWLSRIIRSLSPKGIPWLWDVPIHFLGALTSFGMSNIPTEVSNSFWNTSQETNWLKATSVLRLSLISSKALSTWRNCLCLWLTLPCISVLGVTQWWGLQGELNTNPWVQ